MCNTHTHTYTQYPNIQTRRKYSYPKLRHNFTNNLDSQDLTTQACFSVAERPSIMQGAPSRQICSGNFTSYQTQIEAAGEICYLILSQYTGTISCLHYLHLFCVSDKSLNYELPPLPPSVLCIRKVTELQAVFTTSICSVYQTSH